MHRFFVCRKSISSGILEISSAPQVHHMKNTLRLGRGEEICVVDGQEREYRASVVDVRKDKIILSITEPMHTSMGKKTDLAVACALAKGAKMDDIVDALTQLGVSRIIPMRTERVIVKWNKAQNMTHHKRWQRIATNASQQSKRRSIPRIDEVAGFEQVLEESRGYELKLIPTIGQYTETLPRVLDGGHFRRIMVIIGPEGDFTPQEITQAQAGGFIPITLGKLVLRVDTAAISAASYIYFHANR